MKIFILIVKYHQTVFHMNLHLYHQHLPSLCSWRAAVVIPLTLCETNSLTGPAGLVKYFKTRPAMLTLD